MESIEELGARVGKRLAAQLENGSGPRSSAMVLVGAILSQEPRTKLPAVLADAEVIAFMAEAGVTENMIRQALTNGRRGIKQASAEAAEEIKAPRRKRRKAIANSELPAAESKSTKPDLLAGLVTDTPLEAL